MQPRARSAYVTMLVVAVSVVTACPGRPRLPSEEDIREAMAGASELRVRFRHIVADRGKPRVLDSLSVTDDGGIRTLRDSLRFTGRWTGPYHGRRSPPGAEVTVCRGDDAVVSFFVEGPSPAMLFETQEGIWKVPVDRRFLELLFELESHRK